MNVFLIFGRNIFFILLNVTNLTKQIFLTIRKSLFRNINVNKMNSGIHYGNIVDASGK